MKEKDKLGKYQIAPWIEFRFGGNKGFLYDTKTGQAYGLNELASLIVEQIQNSKNFEEIKAKIIETYEVTEEKAERDTQDFIEQLKNLGVIIENEED